MKITTTYSIKIKHYNHIFDDTVKVYRDAVNFFITLCISEWEELSSIEDSKKQQQYVERASHKTKNRAHVKYDFNKEFYKFPSYLRRAAINESIGKVSSYKSNLSNWKEKRIGNEPKKP